MGSRNVQAEETEATEMLSRNRERGLIVGRVLTQQFVSSDLKDHGGE